jgi:hypothetical protein
MNTQTQHTKKEDITTASTNKNAETNTTKLSKRKRKAIKGW